MPLQLLQQKTIEEFRNEYKKAYKGILSDEILDKGNEWFENFVSSKLAESYALGAKNTQYCNKELPDGSICQCKLDCHLHDWRQKQAVVDFIQEEKDRLTREYNLCTDMYRSMFISDEIQHLESKLEAKENI